MASRANPHPGLPRPYRAACALAQGMSDLIRVTQQVRNRAGIPAMGPLEGHLGCVPKDQRLSQLQKGWGEGGF